MLLRGFCNGRRHTSESRVYGESLAYEARQSGQSVELRQANYDQNEPPGCNMSIDLPYCERESMIQLFKGFLEEFDVDWDVLAEENIQEHMLLRNETG